MRKTVIAAAAALGLVFAAPAMAQNVAPNSNIAIVPLPGMLTACMKISTMDELMIGAGFTPIIRGDVGFVHSDAKIRQSNDEGTRMTIWYSSKSKELVNTLWSLKRGIACITHTMPNASIDDSSFLELGRRASKDDDNE